MLCFISTPRWVPVGAHLEYYPYITLSRTALIRCENSEMGISAKSAVEPFESRIIR